MLPILLMLFMTGGGSGNGDEQDQGGGQGAKQEGDILPKPSDAEPVEVQIVEIGPAVKKKLNIPHEADDCPDFFGGIGIMHTHIGNVITSAPEGYPAANAGIKVGDRLVTPVDGIRGEPGTEVEVTFENETGLHTVTITRDKICTSKITEP